MTVPPDDVLAQAVDLGVHSVRISCVDQHGLLRTKTIDAGRLAEALESGVGLPGSLLAKDTANNYAIPLWAPSGLATLDGLLGARDMVMVPDPATWRVLPWADGVGWLLCDLVTTSGEPITLSTRGLFRAGLADLASRGYTMVTGLELELHLFDETTGEPIHPGWELLGEQHADLVHDRLEPIRAGLTALGSAPRSVEIELGPGQIEMSFAAGEAAAVADEAVAIRSAIAALARRAGMRATFVCRPTADSFPSGWHLHQSLKGADGANAFTPAADTPALLSDVGRSWVAGLLAHAAPSCLLTTPTVNGYKRYRPNSVAPDRVAWSVQHRGAMLRVIGGSSHGAAHVENRVGDPAANPYLYLASQVMSGIDGLRRGLEPPPPTESPYRADGGPLLPRTLGEAIDAFAGSEMYRRAWGDEVVDYLVAIKRSEWRRFQAAVTDWELQEYGRLF